MPQYIDICINSVMMVVEFYSDLVGSQGLSKLLKFTQTWNRTQTALRAAIHYQVAKNVASDPKDLEYFF